MRLFIAREALDPHLKIGGPMLNSQLSTETRARTLGGLNDLLGRLVEYPVVERLQSYADFLLCGHVCLFLDSGSIVGKQKGLSRCRVAVALVASHRTRRMETAPHTAW